MHAGTAPSPGACGECDPARGPGLRTEPTRAAERRRRVGARSARWGGSAEESAAAWYAARGGAIVARRKRTAAGEVDLVVRMGETLAIVEVKARRRLADALQAVSQRQWSRLFAAAEICAAEFGGSVRIDVAALDGAGRLEVVENASLAGAFV